MYTPVSSIPKETTAVWWCPDGILLMYAGEYLKRAVFPMRRDEESSRCVVWNAVTEELAVSWRLWRRREDGTLVYLPPVNEDKQYGQR